MKVVRHWKVNRITYGAIMLYMTVDGTEYPFGISVGINPTEKQFWLAVLQLKHMSECALFRMGVRL